MEKKILNWRVDANTFRLIGRDLITDRITALFELVKNSYDANAENVFVSFCDVSEGAINSKIIIEDDGTGMSFHDIENKWMVVGTSNKRLQTCSPAPYNRTYVGEKGIGRFAVDKLGAKVLIKTKQKGEESWLNVELNSENYDNGDAKETLNLFTDITNTYFYEKAEDKEKHGTKIVITNIRERWTEDNIQRSKKELSKIVSPFKHLDPPFNIFLHSNEYKYQNSDVPIKNDAIDFYSEKISIDYYKDEANPENSYQEILFFDKESKRISKKMEKIQIFGGVSMNIFYFNEKAKFKFNSEYKDSQNRIDGIKIYRDGIITTPFAEIEPHTTKKRDILGIDKRLRSGTFNKIGSADIIGELNITKSENPNIIDATNRQDFIDNKEYRELKEFIIKQIDVLENIKLNDRIEKNRNSEEGLENAQKKSKHVTKNLNKTSEEISVLIKNKSIPNNLKGNLVKVKGSIDDALDKLNNVEGSIKQGLQNFKEAEKENLRRENIYLSLMSLQSYAAEIAHAVNTKIGSIKDTAEGLEMNYSREGYNEKNKEYIKMIISESTSLQSIVDFMLSYTKAGVEDIKDFSIKQSIEKLFNTTYYYLFKKHDIHIELNLEDCLITGHEIFFIDVIQQLINNSIKALEKNADKKIECIGKIDNNCYVILFSDNGCGIYEGAESKIFKLYYTTTAESGGAGIGLWSVQKRIDAMKGKIEVIRSIEKRTGATFKLTIPFKYEL